MFIGSVFAHPEHLLKKPTQQWQRQIALGGLFHSGNNSTKQLDAMGKVVYLSSIWDNTLSVSGRFSRDNSKTISQEFKSILALHRKFHPKFFNFCDGEFKYDKFSTFDIVVQETIGIGWIAFESKKTKMVIEVGPGGRHSRISGIKRYKHEFIGSGLFNYHHHLNKQTTLTQQLSVASGHVNTHLHSESTMKLKMSERLAFELGVVLDYDTDIPSGSVNTIKLDTATRIRLSYEHK